MEVYEECRKEMKTVEILGTDYKYDINSADLSLLNSLDGVCLVFDKEIHVRDKSLISGQSEEARSYRREHVIRHELVHAIAQECGVNYGEDEALVDWIAHIIPIVNKAFGEMKYGDNEGSQSSI